VTEKKNIVEENKEIVTNVEKKENKMGVMPVNRLLVTMAWPMMLSMLVQALYNVVDSIFVSHITTNEVVLDENGEFISAGTDAISALGLAFPVQILIIALGVGTGVGVNAVLSRALGEKDQKTVNSAAVHAVFLMAVTYIINLVIGVFFSHTIISGQGAEGRKLEYGTTYLTIVCCCSLAVYMEIIFERLLQSTGRTLLSMIPQIAGAVINCIMDPILIYGLFGAPKMGVAGAAIATVFGQTVATVIGLWLNLKKNPDIQFSFRHFRPDKRIIGRIYSVGLPAIIMQAVGSVMNFGMNSIILALNQSAVAVFAVYYKLQSFFFMPIIGLGNAMVPIAAYNYGAGRRHRVIQVFKCSLVYAFFLMFIGFLLFELIPGTLLGLFDTGDDTLKIYGIPALRKIGVHYLLAWFCIMASSLFQALGNGVYSMFVSLARQLVVLLPAAYILGKIGGIHLLWWCFPLAELMSLTVCVFFLVRIYRKVIVNIPDERTTV